MIKNRIVQVVYQTVYCTLGVVAIFASLGLFEKFFNADFYVYYTNLSNYICLAVMFVSLFTTISRAKVQKQGYVDTCPRFKFLCSVMIFFTFAVYNIFLVGSKSVVDYFTSYKDLTLHLVLPFMFVIDWILFYEHGYVKWYMPLLGIIIPLTYMAFVMIRATIIGADSELMRFPYFFVDADTLGAKGILLWGGIVLAIYIAIGYIFWGLDHIQKIKFLRQQKCEPKS